MILLALLFKLFVFFCILGVAWWIVTKVPLFEPVRGFIQIAIYIIAGFAVMALLYRIMQIGLPGVLNSMP